MKETTFIIFTKLSHPNYFSKIWINSNKRAPIKIISFYRVSDGKDYHAFSMASLNFSRKSYFFSNAINLVG